jgi:hypothetical protein
LAAVDDEPDLLGDVRRAMGSGEPLDLLSAVSTIMAVVDPRGRDPFERGEPSETLTMPQLVESFIGIERTETSALLAVIGALTADELLRVRIARELGRRGDRLPSWLEGIDEVEVVGCCEMLHILRDGDNVMLDIRFADGNALSIVVYIDHNMGTLVKDAFPVPESLDSVLERMQSQTDEDTELRALDLADARVRITEAIDLGSITHPPFESDTWPACRAILEWIVRRLPDGGVGYERTEWSERDRDELADRFFTSEFGRALDDADHRGLLDSVLWFGTDYGPGDPLRWSAVAAEIIMLDWIPRKIVADAAYLAKLPELLKAFIRFSHAERGIPGRLTADTNAAVDKMAPAYQRVSRSPRPQGVDAILAAVGATDPDGPWDADDAIGSLPSSDDDYRRSILTAAVGAEALDHLDDDPLPDEAFDWTDIPDDIRNKVDEVRAACDGYCDTVLNAEYRTACRRLLARCAAGDPGVFRRRARSETAAAAVGWIVGRANELFTPRGGGTVKELLAHFGLTGSVSQRATTLLRAGGFDRSLYGEIGLGSPDFLVSERRRRLIDARDRWLGFD